MIKEKLTTWWEEQSPKDQRIVIGAALFMVLLILAGGIVVPIYRAHASATERIDKRQQELLTLLQLERSYKSKPAPTSNQFGRGLGTESPIGFVEGIASTIGVKDRIRNIRPGNTEQTGIKRYTNLSVQLEELTMREFTDLMYSLEIGSGIDVEITRFKTTRRERKTTRLEINLDLRILL